MKNRFSFQHVQLIVMLLKEPISIEIKRCDEFLKKLQFKNACSSANVNRCALLIDMKN